MSLRDWVENKRTGYGKYFYQNGERYVGQWSDNMMVNYIY